LELRLISQQHRRAALVMPPGLTPEERRGDANGIWLCQKCARLIDVDDERWSVEIINSWKMEAEDHALRIIGDPQKPIVSSFLHIPPPERFGYNSRVLVDEVPVLKRPWRMIQRASHRLGLWRDSC